MLTIASHNTKHISSLHRSGRWFVLVMFISVGVILLGGAFTAYKAVDYYRSIDKNENEFGKTALSDSETAPEQEAMSENVGNQTSTESTAPQLGQTSQNSSTNSSATSSVGTTQPSEQSAQSGSSGQGTSGSTTTVATPIWQEEFSNALDLTTSSHTGKWRPNDFWQNINRGYRDFAGTSWNLNPNEHPSYNPFSVSNGYLRISARRTPAELNSSIASSMAAQQQAGSVPEWSGGMLITNKDINTFSNGYYEFRVRFPNSGPGMFPAVWLYSADGTLNPGKEGAEIDVLEIFGHSSGLIVDSTLHFLGANNVRYMDSYSDEITGDTSSWHTYAIDRQASYIRFYKDNVLYGESSSQQASWFNGVKMGIRLNYAMDASWFPTGQKSNGSTPNPLYMDVDYVRVYNNKP